MPRILITGGTDGIGRETAIRLAGEKHEITIAGRDAVKASSVIEHCEQSFKNRPHFIQTDLSLTEEVIKFANRVADEQLMSLAAQVAEEGAVNLGDQKPGETVGDNSVAESQYIRIRGLPFEATEQDVHEFFTGLTLARLKFRLTHGRPSGEAYVEFNSREDAGEALKFDRKEMKTRYIEVFTVDASEAEFAMRPDPVDESDGENHVVRLRGLPWSCKDDDIRQFFEGLEPPPAEIVIGGTGGPKTRPSGEAFVRFTSAEAARKAMEYNKKHMGPRYVEVFQSSMGELNREKGFGGPAPHERSGIRPLMSLDRPDPGYGGSSGGYGGGGYGGRYEDQRGGYGGQSDYDGYGSGGGYDQGGYGGDYGAAEPHRIYMRGLPYDADGHAVEAFFSPLRISIVKLGINDQGRPSGDAIAEFEQYDDMVSAMSKNNQRMGRRYVELFYSRDVPGPMRRLLWKEAFSSAAPVPDPVLSGRRGGGPPPPRDSGYSRGGPPRDQWAPRPSYERGGAPRGGGRGGAAPRPPRAEPWGGYGAAAPQPSYDQHGYGAPNPPAASAGGWEGYGYGASAPAPPPPAQTGYDRQREPREAASTWAQQGAYGGWGAGDQRGGY
uniref:RRM domain-containing protein n=1 Tax=Caenorhabditis japonica TaxID=281687 RepID=A0A8R1HRY6_CAEJA